MGGWIDGVEEQTGQQEFERNKNDGGWMDGRPRGQMNGGQVKGTHCGLTAWAGLMRGYLRGRMASGR